MSKLSYLGRPWVIFDATNKDHRRWFEEFQRINTWGRCPARFFTDDRGDLVSMIQKQLIRYYVTKEFGAGNGSRRSKTIGRNSKKLDKK